MVSLYNAGTEGREKMHPNANLGPARRRAALVDDDAQGQAVQDRRQNRAPRALCHLPDGRGRNPERPVR